MRWVQLCYSLNFLWHCLSLGLEWKLNFSCLVVTADFPNLLEYWVLWCNFTASSFMIWNSSSGISSPPLAMFVVMLLKARLTSHSRMSGSRWVITLMCLSESLRSFWGSFSVYSCCFLLISSASVRSISFLPLLCPSLHEMFPWYFQSCWRDV